MQGILYICEKSGVIKEVETTIMSQFCTATKYSVLYKKERCEYKKHFPEFYAYPYSRKPKKIYNGIGRQGILVTAAPKSFLGKRQKEFREHIFKTALLERQDWDTPPEFMLKEDTAKAFLKLYSKSNDYELIWIKQSGTDEPVPAGYKFIGHDISYMPDESGAFSMIGDCLFIPRWHGCDKDGTLFLDDFANLNDNGLFDNWQDAYNYMIKYLNEEWAETGEYAIFEVYSR